MPTKYSYTIETEFGTQQIETLDFASIPKDVQYTTIQYTDDTSIEVVVPFEVQLWRIRTVLKLMGLEDIIANALNSLEEPMKTGALYIWEYGTTVERQSQTVQLLQAVLQMTDEQVDQIFIQANNIQL